MKCFSINWTVRLYYIGRWETKKTADLLHNCVCCSLHVETMFTDKAAHVQVVLIRKILENY